MATHNQVRVVGFLLDDPKVVGNPERGEQCFFQIRTVHRDNVDNYNGPQYQDVIVWYDGNAATSVDNLMDTMKKLVKFDVVDIKGVFNIMSITKKSTCPDCGHVMRRPNSTQSVVYPISLIKLNSMWTYFEHSEDLPERVLSAHYKEVSNQILIIGTVVSKPELITVGKTPCCRYRLGVDRKYYIKSQSELHSDYPWVYSYGQQAEWDSIHLREKALILVDGFIQRRNIKMKLTCEECGKDYPHNDIMTEFVPYSIEYLAGHLTDEDIATLKEENDAIALNEAKNAIFGS